MFLEYGPCAVAGSRVRDRATTYYDSTTAVKSYKECSDGSDKTDDHETSGSEAAGGAGDSPSMSSSDGESGSGDGSGSAYGEEGCSRAMADVQEELTDLLLVGRDRAVIPELAEMCGDGGEDDSERNGGGSTEGGDEEDGGSETKQGEESMEGRGKSVKRGGKGRRTTSGRGRRASGNKPRRAGGGRGGRGAGGKRKAQASKRGGKKKGGASASSSVQVADDFTTFAASKSSQAQVSRCSVEMLGI